eukprot:10199674-Alexandrium_andersonii.AAC.1
MSASLVGSEMCIRDSSEVTTRSGARAKGVRGGRSQLGRKGRDGPPVQTQGTDRPARTTVKCGESKSETRVKR